MDYRGVLLLGSMIGAGAIASMTACSGPDPGAITFTERTSPGGATPAESSSGGSNGGTSSGASGSPTTDGGGGDGGGGGDFVFGTSTFAPGAATKQANEQAAGDHAGNVEGKNCTEVGKCHGAGGNGPTWAFGGTVKTAKTGGQPVVGAEVRIGMNGVEFGKTYTDNAGNFWFEKTNGDPPTGARVGVRTAAKKMEMASPVSGAAGGACNSGGCHGMVPTASAQGFILLP